MSLVVEEMEPSVSSLVDRSFVEVPGDDGYLSDGELDGYDGHVLQQQWVTLTANMWPEPTASPRGWRVTTEKLPLLAAVFCGAALVVCVLFAFVIYRCCIMPRKEKNYCLRKGEGATTTTQVPSIATPSYQINQAAVYAEQKGRTWGYNNRLVNPSSSQGGHWLYNSIVLGGPQCTQCPGICPVPRSSSHPGGSSNEVPQSSSSRGRKQRPVSQPIHIGSNNTFIAGDEYQRRIQMPKISEFSPHGTTQYASSSILDEAQDKDGETDVGEGSLKTRSLPAWVRSKPRPLSTEDDLNNLYAKVNFSKKRKNRMRNDEAAIIAKSRSQFLHKDTDSLVDNEAVIVYDERTAL